MSGAALYKTTLASGAKRRLLRNLFIGVLVLAVVIYSEGLDLNWLQWVGFTVVVAIMLVQLATLVSARQPVALFDHGVEIASLGKFRIARENITGLTTHPKTGDPALRYVVPEKNFEGVIRLPWRLIEQDRDAVVDAFKQHYGLSFEGAGQ